MKKIFLIAVLIFAAFLVKAQITPSEMSATAKAQFQSVLEIKDSTWIDGFVKGLGYVDGITASAIELNINDGLLATTAELNRAVGLDTTISIQDQLGAKIDSNDVVSGEYYTTSETDSLIALVTGVENADSTVFNSSNRNLLVYNGNEVFRYNPDLISRTTMLEFFGFDESSGTFTGFEGSTATGTGVTYEATGKIDRAVGFNTSTDVVTVPMTTDIFPSSNAITISMWFKLDTLPSVSGRDYDLFSANGSSDPYVSIDISIATNDRINFAINNGANTISGNPGLVVDTWYHLVCVKEDATARLRMYVNGVDENYWNSGTFTGTLYIPDTQYSIGNNHYETKAIMGMIDLVGIWDEALDSTTVVNEYNAGNGKDY